MQNSFRLVPFLLFALLLAGSAWAEFQIVSFELEPNTISVDEAGSAIVGASVGVRNLSPGSPQATVEIDVFDEAGNSMLSLVGPLPSASDSVGSTPVLFDQDDGLTFDALGAWERGNYAVHAKVYDGTGALNDQKMKVLTVGLVKTPVPEFSLLLLPALLAVVLFVLKKK